MLKGLPAEVKALYLERGLHALAGKTFKLSTSAVLTNADPVVFEVVDVDMDGITVRLDAPMRLVQTSAPPDIRCPHCGKKLGTRVVGTYETVCPRCHKEVVITR